VTQTRGEGCKMRFPEATVFVREVGEGPPLLLINGLGAHSAMWEPLESVLAGHRIVEFDLPGAGQSEIPWMPVSIKRLAVLTASVMAELGMERADVLGYSMGGVVAQQLAADFPERVRRLVLVATTPGLGAMQGDPLALINIMTPLRYISRHAYTRTVGTLTGGRARTDPAWVAQQGALRLSFTPSWRGYMGQLMSMAPWSGLPLLPTITQPTLVVTGDDDPLTPVVNSMLLAHLLPNARLLVCPDEGHLLVMDDTSISHPAISEFLSTQRLSRARVWREGETVDADTLQAALFGAPLQLPPLSIINSMMRRRWLNAATGPAE
jgi:pimeloyl-ACP methyl ester carboxylesterase